MINCYIECDKCESDINFDLEDYIDDYFDDVKEYVYENDNNLLDDSLLSEYFDIKFNTDDLKIKELQKLYKNLSLVELEDLTKSLNI